MGKRLRVLLLLLGLGIAGGLIWSQSREQARARQNDDWIEAVKVNDTATMQSLVEQGANLEARDDIGRTALMLTTMTGARRAVQTLLRKGVQVNAQDNAGKSALAWAALSDQPELARLLLERGADVNQKQKDGQTPLMLAAMREHTSLLNALLAGGADVQATDGQGRTSLMMAAANGRADAVKILLAHGAKANAINRFGESPLMLAVGSNVSLRSEADPLVEKDRAETVNTLLSAGAQWTVREKYGTTVLHRAVRYGHLPVVQALLERKADVNATDDAGETPLMWTVEWAPGYRASPARRAEIVQALLKAGANLRARNRNGQSVWQLATLEPEVTRVLLAHGVAFAPKEPRGAAALYFAAGKNCVDVVEALLNRGVDINAAFANGETALVGAAQHGSAEAVAVLLRHGAHDGAGSARSNAAPTAGDTSLRLQRQARVAALTQAAFRGDAAKVEALLAGGLEANARDLGGNTAVHWAVGDPDIFFFGRNVQMQAPGPTKGRIQALQRLLAQGADINAANTKGTTALMIAAAYGDTDLIEELLQHGIEVRPSDRIGAGRNAMQWAIATGHTDAGMHLQRAYLRP
jgi:ankyrin repeat protein